jgi:hypothetical protein
MKKLNYLALGLVASFTFNSCSNDDNVVPVNEEEVITTVITTLKNDSETITLTSRDLDGDGPNKPQISVSGTLKVNTTYTGSVSFLNELASPAEDITLEVKEEGNDHQVFYETPASIGGFTYTDSDGNAKPIGLTFTLTTGASAASGNIFVTLIHRPNKSAAGVSDGDKTNAGGGTDALVTYPVQVVLNN